MSESHRNNLSDVIYTLQNGVKRAVPTAKQNKHFGEFTNIVNLLNSLQLDSSLFEQELTLEEFTNKSDSLLPQLTRYLLNSVAPQGLLDNVYDYLSQEDSLEIADYIFVFGSRDQSRPKKAAELFLSGLAPKIYCSGNHPIEEPNRPNESQIYREFILSNFKIPEESVVADQNKNSITMNDNVRGFLNYLDENEVKTQKIIMVINTHNLRRGWTIFNKYADSQKIIRCSCGDRPETQKGNWFQTEMGIKLIYEEYEKIKIQHIANTS